MNKEGKKPLIEIHGRVRTSLPKTVVWMETINTCISRHYPYLESIPYTNLQLPIHPIYDHTFIDVINSDTFLACSQYVKQGYNVVALNMACERNPGGGVRKGSSAQEEDCFRRSNYFQSLTPDFYPLPPETCIYTPIVTVIKDEKYKLLDEPFIVSMIACAATRNPLLLENGDYKYPIDRKTMLDKINQIFQIAYLHNKDTIILSALGCGAFHNPPIEVAQMFNEIMTKYKGCFKNLIYAVKSFRDPNFDIFSKIINRNL